MQTLQGRRATYSYEYHSLYSSGAMRNTLFTLPIKRPFIFPMDPYTHLLCLLFFLPRSLGRLDFSLGSRVTIRVPPAYQPDFRGRAYFLDAGKPPPSFRAALSMDPINGKYSCSLSVFLADLRVWSSDHLEKFLAVDGCLLELAGDGNLLLQDGTGQIGWQTGTPQQGIKALWLQKKTGNLVLADSENRTIWQSFDFPGDILLQGQQLNVPARLTSFPTNSSASYSLEFRPGNLSMYLNWRDSKYLYWEFTPPGNKSLASVVLSSTGLKLFDSNWTKIEQIRAMSSDPVRFIALESNGNLGLYHYSAQQGIFEASYRAITKFCDLPLPCGPYQICSASNSCTCVQQATAECAIAPDCNSEVEMLEIDGVDTVLRATAAIKVVNVSEESCVSSCQKNCSCKSVVYTYRRECFRYGLAAGARKTERVVEFSYWVKVAKGKDQEQGASTRLKKKLLLVAGTVLDGLLVCAILGGLLYYYFKIRRTDNS